MKIDVKNVAIDAVGYGVGLAIGVYISKKLTKWQNEMNKEKIIDGEIIDVTEEEA